VLRHRRLRYPSATSQGVNCLFPVADQALEDRPTGGVGEGLEKIVRYGLHVETITIRLWVVKLFWSNQTTVGHQNQTTRKLVLRGDRSQWSDRQQANTCVFLAQGMMQNPRVVNPGAGAEVLGWPRNKWYTPAHQ